MQNATIILFSLISIITTSLAQQTPLFEIPLYFEDAVGNKDTIIVGYDEDASSYEINPQFGENQIWGPYDEEFEVRARKIPFVVDLETKKCISSVGFGPSGGCGVSNGTTIMVRLKNPPLKVSWNKDLMQTDDCRRGSFLAPSEHWAVVPDLNLLEPWMIHCLFEKEEVFIDFTGQNTLMYSAGNILDTVENVGLDTIQWMGLVFTSETCPDLIDNVENLIIETNSISVFPNPVNQRITIDTEEEVVETRIYNSQGSLVLSKNLGGQKEFDVQLLSSGIYLGWVELKSGRHRTFRFIKQ